MDAHGLQLSAIINAKLRLELSDVLRDIDVKKTNYGNWGDQNEFDTFIKLVLCELNGISTDCNYMVFDARNVRDQPARDYDGVAFISKKYEENVVRRLIEYSMRHSRSHVQGETVRVYAALCQSINDIKKWHNFNEGLADADYSAQDGAEYEKEIIRRIVTLIPASIYFAVGKRMQSAKLHKIFSQQSYNLFHLVPPASLPALRLGEQKGIF